MARLFELNERAHYGFILMTALASAKGTLTLAELADRTMLSHGYLEEVAGALREHGLIAGKRGPGGGYQLMREPSEVSLKDVLTALEGPLAVTACQDESTAGFCPVAGQCSSKKLAGVLQTTLTKTMESISLADVL